MKPKHWVYPVSKARLYWCKARIEYYQAMGNLEISVVAKDNEFASHLRLLRSNHLLGKQAISPNMFRHSADTIARELINRHIRKAIPHTAIGLFPWRAGLVFLYNFMSSPNVKPLNAYHLGASRDEKTLHTKIYFEEPAPLLVENKFSRHELVHCYVMDPMLATGNTTITAIERLLKYQVRKESITDAMITVVSLFAAPEGVARLIQKYPRLRVITVALDDHLDERGFIVPGCGDFGDQYTEGLTAKHFKNFRIYEWFSSHAWTVFSERMGQK